MTGSGLGLQQSVNVGPSPHHWSAARRETPDLRHSLLTQPPRELTHSKLANFNRYYRLGIILLDVRDHGFDQVA